MKEIITILFSVIAFFNFWGIAEGQIIIVQQDFDTNTSWHYDTSIPFFDDGWGTSYFGIIDINSASPLEKADFNSNILGENDLESTNGTDGFVNITFEEIDISGNSNVEISFDYQIIGYNANGDDARYEVFHDGVGQGQVDLHDGGSDPDDTEGSIVLAIPNTVNDIYITLSIRNNGQTGYSGFDNFRLFESSIEPEPSNHVTAFIASSSSISNVDLSWTDATGATIPDAYLILANDTDSFTVPSDGTPQPDDSDLSDGSGVLNVVQGVESTSFSDLEPNTQYFFEIYPYTNLGGNIDYKTDGVVPSNSTSTLEKPDLVLNEILADPNGDANGDGTFDTSEDEFLEFVNIGNTDLDISGWIISDETSDRHIFLSNTVLKPYQAIVVFDGGTPTGDFGSSITQVAGNLSLNNNGEIITLKDESGNTLIEESYPGAIDQSDTRDPDLTGSFENHTTSDTDDGSSYSPGTRINGSTFQPSVTINSGEGWRMISSPTEMNSYDDFLFNLWTQGTNGTDYSGGDPNVMTFDGSSFAAVSDLESDMMVSGQGFIVYVYSDDDYNLSSADAGFPKNIDLFGVPNSGEVDINFNSGSGTWSVAGNPYIKPIDWDELDTSDLEGTVYVYDHAYGTIDGGGDDVAEAGSVGGGYRTWNGSAGSLSNGIIAPFQGFWVQSTGTSPGITFQESDQTTGGTFYTKENNNVISLRLRSEMDNMFSEAFLSFSETGQLGDDKNDGLKLSPLDFRNYISLSTEVEGTQMDINNLPVELYNLVEIPLHVQAFEAVESGWKLMSGEVKLSWPEMNNIPSEWNITLTDTKLNRTIDLRSANNYVFEAEVSRTKIANKEPFSPSNPEPFQKEKTVIDARFLITIDPNVPDGLIDDDIPDQFTLEQNYPNPFNPTTNIKFEIPETSDVTLSVFNVMGQRIATLVNESKAPGTYEIAWDAQEMASGIYYYRLRAEGVVFNRQMTLIK